MSQHASLNEIVGTQLEHICHARCFLAVSIGFQQASYCILPLARNIKCRVLQLQVNIKGSTQSTSRVNRKAFAINMPNGTHLQGVFTLKYIT